MKQSTKPETGLIVKLLFVLADLVGLSVGGALRRCRNEAAVQDEIACL
ncbi:MAG: hypothetical protein LBT21_06545 [Oscillospiraceae bacterium]|nr:hypothetical protein [Oscillospiraceae bacterium]